MLLALGVAMSIMTFVLLAGLRRELTTPSGDDRGHLERPRSSSPTQFVVPDWGTLVGLIPILLLVLDVPVRHLDDLPVRDGRAHAPRQAPADPGRRRPASTCPAARSRRSSARSACSCSASAWSCGGVWLLVGADRPGDHAALLGPRVPARLRPPAVLLDRHGRDRRHRPGAGRCRHPARCRRPRDAAAGRPHPGAVVPPAAHRDVDDAPGRRAHPRRLGADPRGGRARRSRCSAGCSTPSASTGRRSPPTGPATSTPGRRPRGRRRRSRSSRGSWPAACC